MAAQQYRAGRANFESVGDLIVGSELADCFDSQRRCALVETLYLPAQIGCGDEETVARALTRRRGTYRQQRTMNCHRLRTVFEAA